MKLGFIGVGNITSDVINGIFKSKLKNCKIKITESNDIRSYRQCSEKLMKMGFKQSKNIDNAIDEIITSFKKGLLNTDNTCFSVKRLKELDIK